MFECKQESFPEKEECVLAFWERGKIFEKSLTARQSGPLFSFYDGPPFATGLPHYGHILAGTLKDVIPRYKTMQGFYVPRRFGWDCHGLPVENEIEKAQGLSGAASIESFGIARFNEECRSIVLRYTEEWKKTVKRIGRWVSFEDTYRTMDLSFMESVWWVFGQLYEQGLIYEGFKVMPFSTKLGTPLSNFEANLNYKEVDDPSLTVLFTLKKEPHKKLLVWTTTPWTLPSNLAVMVQKDVIYVELQVEKTGQIFLLAKEAVARYAKEIGSYQVVQEKKGADLVGLEYEPLFPYFAQHPKAFRIISEDSLLEGEGTGIVHAAPAFGEVDFYACAREGIEPICPVDHGGFFTKQVPDFALVHVKEADKEIIRRLKAEGKVLVHAQIRHRYPFCWRSDTPLIYKTVRTWFVAVEKIKDKMLRANEQIHFVPSHIQHGRFGKWLENARDWAISRNRYWGTPIPIWRSEEGEIRVITSVQELEKKTNTSVTDLHRHFIDDLTFIENGKVFRRIPEVFDCWFESGSMPYAQNHYPFEHQAQTLEGFPADFIAEGLDQTRGWFYTLTVLSSALFSKPAFKNVIVNGILLAEDGNKMSKRLKNYPEPDHVFSKHGVDAMRLYLLGSPAVEAEDLRFSEKEVERIVRQLLLPLWNSFVFLSTYAKIDGWIPQEFPLEKQAEEEIDRWMLSVLQTTLEQVTQALDSYVLHKAIGAFSVLVEQLTNWYIRRNRSRFWQEGLSSSKEQAYQVLYTVVKTIVKMMAPFAPFITEAIYQELRVEQDPVSVHLEDFPKVHAFWKEADLEKEMSLVQMVVSHGHALRKEHKMRVRQPLSRALIIARDPAIIESLRQKETLIMEELNVKAIEYSREEKAFVQLVARPNFRVLGKKVGDKMPQVQKEIAALSQEVLQAFLEGEELVLSWGVVSSQDLSVERKVLEGVVASSLEGVTVALDITMTPALQEEGIAREIVNRVNQARKDRGFQVTDQITIALETTPWVEHCFRVHQEYICKEVLAVDFRFCALEASALEAEVCGESLRFMLT